MSKVEILRGFPASGKSTYAREQVRNSEEVIRVNKDDLRRMLHDDNFTKQNEKVTVWMRDAIIREALRRNLDVIVDDTNLHPSHEKQIRKLSVGHNVEVKDFFDVPVNELYQRDSGREHPVGRAVIDKMVKRWEKWKNLPTDTNYAGEWKPAINYGSFDAWIVDIDGTLASHEGIRSPYDFSKVILDRPIRPVTRLVRDYLRQGGRVFFFSGRDDSCYKDTFTWIETHVGPQNIEEDWVNWTLHMRTEGDKRRDDIVKSEMFDQIVEPSDFEVSIVIDDRKQVKRMWVARGLFVLDVNQEDREF